MGKKCHKNFEFSEIIINNLILYIFYIIKLLCNQGDFNER
ncbi:hypothetical protein GMMP1_660020 [Candidatus Magnetomoraceae bacterium gMMP-1]